MRHILFSKNCSNTETYSFTIHAIRIFDELNDHSLPVRLQLALVRYKHLFLLSTSIECLTKKKLEIVIYPQKFCSVRYEISANYSLFSTSHLIEIKQYQFS